MATVCAKCPTPEAAARHREKTRLWRLANKQHISEYNGRYAREHRERLAPSKLAWSRAHGEQKARYTREYRERKIAEMGESEWAILKRAEYDRNIATYRAYSKNHYAANREDEKRKATAWARANRERRRTYLATRADDSYDGEYAAILRLDPCSYCGGPGGQIDHVTPVFAGGRGDFSNLTSACKSCNPAKGKLPLLVFLAERC